MNSTAWNNGSVKISGSGYGLRISKKDRDTNINPKWNHIRLLLPNGVTVSLNLSKSFWKNCVEFRSKEIGAWLINNGYGNWKKGNPPKFTIKHIRGNKFELI